MMFNGYPICPALTSLVLLASLATTPPWLRAPACSDIGRLYSPRLLRQVRARLMIAYAESHERRAAEVSTAIRNHNSVEPPVQKDQLHVRSQESDGPKLKHLLAYIAMNCL